MGWGWLCCAKKRGFVAGFPQILGFFRLIDLKKRPLQNFHFATAPTGGTYFRYGLLLRGGADRVVRPYGGI